MKRKTKAQKIEDKAEHYASLRYYSFNKTGGQWGIVRRAYLKGYYDCIDDRKRKPRKVKT